jgi:putative membrane protein
MWGGSGMGGGMWIWFLLFIGGGWFFFRWWARSSRYPRYGRYEENPMEIAQMRLAKGEITHEEFEEIRKTLET